jgi:hypothetical protein
MPAAEGSIEMRGIQDHRPCPGKQPERRDWRGADGSQFYGTRHDDIAWLSNALADEPFKILVADTT